MQSTPRKSSLKTSEASFVLGRSYMQVRRMVDRGELARTAVGICPDSVRGAVRRASMDADLRLRLQALDLISAGRIRVPSPAGGRWAQPLPITDLPRLLVPSPKGRR
jgi:hypothetical protein